jgi:hypothetical protein
MSREQIWEGDGFRKKRALKAGERGEKGGYGER